MNRCWAGLSSAGALPDGGAAVAVVKATGRGAQPQPA